MIPGLSVGQAFLHPQPMLTLTTDASIHSWGVHVEMESVAGTTWAPEEVIIHSQCPGTVSSYAVIDALPTDSLGACGSGKIGQFHSGLLYQSPPALHAHVETCPTLLRN